VQSLKSFLGGVILSDLVGGTAVLGYDYFSF
jgi:hypothetical protein